MAQPQTMQLGNTQIASMNEDFIESFNLGKECSLDDQEDTPILDAHALSEYIVDNMTPHEQMGEENASPEWMAGFVIGYVAGMFEKSAEQVQV